MSAAEPILETGRLLLRRPEASDLNAYTTYRASRRAEFAGGPESAATAFHYFCAMVGHWTIRGFGRFVIEHRESGVGIGHVGPHQPVGHPETELTWTLWNDEFEGAGLAYEAAVAARDYALGTVRPASLVSYIDPGNARSIKLAERLGARPDSKAELPDWSPCTAYRHPSPETLQ